MHRLRTLVDKELSLLLGERIQLDSPTFEMEEFFRLNPSWSDSDLEQAAKKSAASVVSRYRWSTRLDAFRLAPQGVPVARPQLDRDRTPLTAQPLRNPFYDSYVSAVEK